MYERQFDLGGKVDVDKVMAAVGGVVAAGAALDMTVSRRLGRWKDDSGKKEEKKGEER
jgi:hypothetical protein